MATKHTCGGPVFGRRTDGCHRCDELKAGASPVRWASQDHQRRSEIRDHFTSEKHRSGGCGPVCTFGDW